MAEIDRVRLERRLADERERFVRTHPRSAALSAQAHEHLLTGVPMAWMTRWPGSFPIFCARAEGARLTDVDGHEYVDFALGDTGAMTGHARPFVTEAVGRQAARGITTMLPSEDAIWVAAELSRRFGLPLWQFALTATDANRFALRIARHLTGRPKILVFDWCYHGSVDETLVTADESGATRRRDSNLGPQVDPALTTRVVQFNDVPALEAALALGDVACVLAEPALTNIGIVLPDPGYHDALRRITRETGTILIIDETHTICAGPGGATAAWGLEPDMLTIGKPIGGGVPTAAYGLSVELGSRLVDFFSSRGGGRQRHRRDPGRERPRRRVHAGGPGERPARGGLRHRGPPRGDLDRRRGRCDRRARPALDGAAAGVPRRVLVPGAPAQRTGSRRGRRR